MNVTTEPSREAGYLSEESQRTFTIVAGVLGALFFILQFAVPMVAMFALMPRMMTVEMSTLEIAGAASFRGAVHLVESTQVMEAGRRADARTRLVRLGSAGLEALADLGGWKPRLLADGERLWLLSSDRIALFDGRKLDFLTVAEPRGDLSQPFLLGGRPTVVESRPEGSQLLTWDGAWTPLRGVTGIDNPCCVQFVAIGDDVTAFRQDGATLYARSLEAADARWQVVASKPREWHALLRRGAVAVVVATEAEGLRLLERDGERWRATPLAADGGRTRMLSSLVAFEEADGALTLLTSGWPGSIKVRRWDGTRLGPEQRHGSSSPFPAGMMAVMWLPHAFTPLLSLALAVILSWLMRVHRVGVHVHDGRQALHASLTRRALSQLVDAALLAGPGVWSFTRLFLTLDTEVMLEGPFRLFGPMALALGWALLVFVAFSVGEGLWGVTPGKWLASIRVVGTDLRPCGIGRALVRNVLKLIDGFFNFLIGILMVAYTRDWQRLGDLAARTIVVRTPLPN